MGTGHDGERMVLDDARRQALAQRMARACRRVVQACLREEEWLDADEAFQDIILAGLKELEVPDAIP